jgi:2-isopropylmalate synthase
MTQKDIDRAWEAIRHARKPRLHVLGAASDLHLTYKLHITREQP